MKKRQYRCGLIVGIILGLMVGTPGVEGAKDTLIIGLEEKSTSLDPAKLGEVVSTHIAHKLYETLVTFNVEEDYTKPVPDLAESWEVSEDGKTWTFRLRKKETGV